MSSSPFLGCFGLFHDLDCDRGDDAKAPRKECSAAQKRIADDIAAVLTDVFADTSVVFFAWYVNILIKLSLARLSQEIVDSWNQNRERCFETIKNKI